MDLSVTGMRVFREVAERGSFTAAAAALGYTQSAVSRQVAALESAVGRILFRRHRYGVQLTAAGRAVLRHTTLALDEIDAALRTAHRPPSPPVVARLGAYPAAGAVLLPRALAALRRSHPELDVTTREGTTRPSSGRCGPAPSISPSSPRPRRSGRSTRRIPSWPSNSLRRPTCR